METSDIKIIESNIWKLYLFNMLRGMFFSVPVIVLFWQENGLSLTEIMLLQSFCSILIVGLEIPTGYMSDIYGRKKTLFWSALSGLLAIITYGLSSNFYGFLLAELFFALNISFSSGTLSALFYDTLLDLKKEKSYKKLWGNLMFYGMIVLSIASVIGGYIASYDLRYTIYASIPFFFLMLPLSLMLHEPKRHKITIKSGYIKELFLSIKNNFLKSEKLKWIIIYSSIIYGFNQAAFWLYQPYFKLIGVDIVYFGLIFASFQIVAAFSSKYAYKIEKFFGEKYSLVLLIFLVSASYFLMSNFIMLFSFSFAFIHQFIRGFKKIVVTDYINKLTSSHIRATILSVESFISRLFYALIIPFIGWVADVYTLVQALTILGVTSLFSGVIVIYFFHRNKIL